MGPHIKSNNAYVLDQLDERTKKFDEHKLGIGWGSKAQFVTAYKRAFSDGKGHQRIGAVHEMTVPQLKHWLAHGNTKAPFNHPEVVKLSHTEANYEPKAQNMAHRCAVCIHFVSVRHGGAACVLVANPISPQGWCKHFRGHKK